MEPQRVLSVISFKLAIVLVVLSTILAGLFSLVMPKKYRVQATLMVFEPFAERGLDRDYRKLEFAIESYSRVLKSLDLISAVISEMNLDKPPAKFTVEQLAKLIKVKPVRDSQLVRIEMKYNDPKLAADIINRLVSKFLDFHSLLMAREVESTQKFYKEQLINAENKLKELDLEIMKFQKQYQLDELEKRRDVVLGKIGEFKKSLSYNQIEREQAIKEIEESRAKLRALSKEQVSLRSHIIATGTDKTRLKDELNRLDLKLKTIDSQEEEVKIAVENLRYEVANLQRKMEEGQDISLQDLTNLNGMIAKLPSKVAGEADIIKAASEVQKIIVELNPIYKEVESKLISAEIYLARLEAEQKALKDALAKAEKEYEELNAKISELSRINDELWRKHDVYTKTYEELSSQIEQLRIDVAAKIAGVALVESALIPSKPISPNILKNVSAAFVLSTLFAASLLYLKFSYLIKRDESKAN